MATTLLNAPGSLINNGKSSTVLITALTPEDLPQEAEKREDHLLAFSRLVDATYIVSSPYSEVQNQLDLRPLDQPTRLFAMALSYLTITRPDFRLAPYLDSFNWPIVFSTLRALCLLSKLRWHTQEFYVVIFRSKLRHGIDRRRLGELDQKSHEEACASGGLLKYWFGSCDDEMRNLATCPFIHYRSVSLHCIADVSQVSGVIDKMPQLAEAVHGIDKLEERRGRCTNRSHSIPTSSLWDRMQKAGS